MKFRHAKWLKRLAALFEASAPDPARLLRRIEIVERNVVLPVKAVFIGMIFNSFNPFNRSPWIGQAASALDVAVQTVQFVFWFYVLISVVLAIVLLAVQKLPAAIAQWATVTGILVDGIFLAGLTLVTGGLDSILFWLFVALVVRNAASVPPGALQLILNSATSLCYALVAVLDVSVANNLDDATRRTLELAAPGGWGEPFALRMVVLFLTALCCYGAQIFWQREQKAAEEAGEFAARESQLRSAGRLAAEFAHQIKNPLAVINSAAFSLQRSLRENKNSGAQQIEIIQEEVARADRVVTQIMGYAQLSEGRVEKLDVVEELERAVAQVFPPATQIQIHRQYTPHFPPLLMQRGHLSEIFVNLLKNAGEALGENGNIFVKADYHPDQAIEISIRDDGPGVSPDKRERIFEAYYTTKEKGSGLGLAIVKHDAELYGGAIRVESEVGKGANFILTFPAKAIVNIRK